MVVLSGLIPTGWVGSEAERRDRQGYKKGPLEEGVVCWGDHFLALLPWGQSLKMAEMKRRVGREEAEANFEGGCYEKRGLGN